MRARPASAASRVVNAIRKQMAAGEPVSPQLLHDMFDIYDSYKHHAHEAPRPVRDMKCALMKYFRDVLGIPVFASLDPLAPPHTRYDYIVWADLGGRHCAFHTDEENAREFEKKTPSTPICSKRALCGILERMTRE